MAERVLDLHVLPDQDVREHQCTRECWCHPWCVPSEEDDAIVVVHHSVDGHELIEEHGIN